MGETETWLMGEEDVLGSSPGDPPTSPTLLFLTTDGTV